MARILGIAVAAALSISGLFASPALAAGDLIHVQAGSLAFGATSPIGGGNRFYPANVAIHPGGSIAFNVVGAHLLAVNRPPGPIFTLFGPPSFSATLASPTQAVNSSIIGDTGPTTFTLTFASTLPPGRYTVICGLHIGMKETVHVLPMSARLPKTDAEYGAIAQKQITRDLDTLRDIAATANKRGDDEDEDSGLTVWVGAGNNRVSNLRFFPGTATVHVGQKITFLKTHDPTEPHTVTFGTEPSDPLLQLLPRGGSTYSGTENVNSGFMATKAQFAFYQLAGTPLPVALTKYTLTFTTAGTFSYFCAIHDGVGMKATVVVLP